MEQRESPVQPRFETTMFDASSSSATHARNRNPFDHAELASRQRLCAEAVRRMRDAGAKFVQLEFADLNSQLRGKLAKVDKIKAAGIGVSSALYALTYGEELFAAPIGCYADGFFNFLAVPDADSTIHWPWKPAWCSVLHDIYWQDGRPCMIDPRQVLKQLVRRGEKQGLEFRVGVELECHAFHADEATIRDKRYTELTPFGRIPNAFGLHRFPHFDDLAAEFMSRMDAIGAPVEMFHTELGRGCLEFSLSPLPALAAADAGSRAKLYIKQLFAERNLIVTFMSKWHHQEVACGGHHHISLFQDGKNALNDPRSGDLSEIGRHFVAGLSRSLPDLHLLFRPTVNTYRRFDVMGWNPENNAWGHENRIAALRFIKTANPEGTRIENRCPGPDINPYLTIAALVAGGLYGVENKLDPPEPAVGNPKGDRRWEELPRTLKASAERLRGSAFAREWLGEDLVTFLVLKTEAEIKSWGDRRDPEVTVWEYDRYFEST